MPDESSVPLLNVQIDGVWHQFPKGTRVIEACRQAGVFVPHYCYHPKLSSPGNCRMCLVEMVFPRLGPDRKPELGADGRPIINWMPRPQISCAQDVSEGMAVRTDSPLVKECQRGVMEFLLINHPLDCPICDQAGECLLQEYAVDYGNSTSRFLENKVKKPKRVQLGPRVTLDDERCILCSRCIRFCQEIAHDDVLGFVDRGIYTVLTAHPGKLLENNYSLNTLDICPVGALTSTDFRFKMRVWFLKQTDGIVPESSVGCNTIVWSREGVIYRITPRRNDEVNDTWMPDSGREIYKQVRADDRLDAVKVNGIDSSLDMAVNAAAQILKEGAAAIVGSGRSSVEEQFLAGKLGDALGAPAWLVGRVGRGDGILLSADRNPNVRGALVTGLIRELPAAQLTALAAKIDAGEIKTVISVGEDLAAAGLTEAQITKVRVIYLGTHANAPSAVAAVLL